MTVEKGPDIDIGGFTRGRGKDEGRSSKRIIVRKVVNRGRIQ